MSLKGKQARFVEEYLVDLNATQAAIRAGYSPRNADKIGPKLVGKSRIAAAITVAQTARASRTQVTQDRVVQELAILDFSNVQHYRIDAHGDVTLAEGVPASAYRAVSSLKKKIRYGTEGEITYETEIRLWDKVSALRLTGQHLGMFVEKHEHSGTIEVQHRLVSSLESALGTAYAHSNGTDSRD